MKLKIQSAAEYMLQVRFPIRCAAIQCKYRTPVISGLAYCIGHFFNHQNQSKVAEKTELLNAVANACSGICNKEQNVADEAFAILEVMRAARTHLLNFPLKIDDKIDCVGGSKMNCYMTEQVAVNISLNLENFIKSTDNMTQNELPSNALKFAELNTKLCANCCPATRVHQFRDALVRALIDYVKPLFREKTEVRGYYAAPNTGKGPLFNPGPQERIERALSNQTFRNVLRELETSDGTTAKLILDGLIKKSDALKLFDLKLFEDACVCKNNPLETIRRVREEWGRIISSKDVGAIEKLVSMVSCITKITSESLLYHVYDKLTLVQKLLELSGKEGKLPEAQKFFEQIENVLGNKRA